LFIESAKILIKKYPQMIFHVVGDFNESEIEIESIKNNIKFYGVQGAKFLADLYNHTDIFLTPNRPNILYEGAFDGFPLGRTHAQFCGVAIFTTDELNMNKEYTMDEIVIIKPDVNDIVSKIEKYFQSPTDLYELSRKGQQRCLKIVNSKLRTQEILEIMKSNLES